MRRFVLPLALLLISGGVGWWLSSRNDERRGVVERVTKDTLRYDSIRPIEVQAIAPDECDNLELSSDPAIDSLYTFRDTVRGRWSAEVSGSNVALRSLVLVDEVEHRTIYEPPQWEVSLRGGVTPYSTWVGVGVTHNWERVSLSVEGGYDPLNGSPYVGVSASIPLWRKR